MKKIAYSILAFSPMLAFAQTGFNTGYFDKIITFVAGAIRNLIPVAFGLAVIYFFYGMAKFILASGNADEVKKGKSIMIYGVVALAIMSSIWGITAYLKGIIGIGNGGAPDSVILPGVTN